MKYKKLVPATPTGNWPGSNLAGD